MRTPRLAIDDTIQGEARLTAAIGAMVAVAILFGVPLFGSFAPYPP